MIINLSNIEKYLSNNNCNPGKGIIINFNYSMAKKYFKNIKFDLFIIKTINNVFLIELLDIYYGLFKNKSFFRYIIYFASLKLEINYNIKFKSIKLDKLISFKNLFFYLFKFILSIFVYNFIKIKYKLKNV